MKNRVHAAVLGILLLALVTLPVVAADETPQLKGVAGPAQGVIPRQATPTKATAQAQASEEENERAEANAPPPASQHSRAEHQRRKSQARQPNQKSGGREIHLDSTPTPLAPNVGTNFNGLGQNGWIPYDAAIAVGPNHVVVMTNSQWIVYDRAGATVRTVTSFATWWGTPAGTPFDPKCFYDPVGGRFVMMAVSETSTGGNKAFYHLSISQTGDPTGTWYNYQFDATKDGTTSTANWSDFPGLGYDDNAVYITSNQFTFSGGGIFQYAKIRVLSKTQLYAGSAATFTDFVGASLRNSDTTQAFTVQPARTLSSTASEYFLNTNSNSNNTVTLWRVDGAPASPTLVRQATFSVGMFTFPPDAPQLGSATLVATNDDRMYDIVWRSGVIHASFGEGFSGLAAARYLRLDTTGNTVLKDVTYTQPGVHYYFPAVTDDAAGNLYMIFSRSSSSEYPSVYQTGMTPADSAIEPSAVAKAGVAPNTSGRWGDYSAIVNDPADSLAVVSYAGWGNTSNRWATWVTGMTFAGGTPTPTLLSVTPSSGILGANVNVTLAGQNTHWVQGTSTIGISGSNVSASNINVTSATSLTATFNIGASAATGTRNVTVTTGSEVTTSAPFIVNSSASPPTLSSIAPSRTYVGTTTTHTLTGTNFVAGMTVNVSGTFVSAGNVNVTSSTQATVNMTASANAATGNRTVSVTTSGGTSGTLTFLVVGVPVITNIAPGSGNPGATVGVNIQGSQFNGGTPLISGNGVTIQNGAQILNGGTKITANFIIAANAAAGARNVTVVNGAGTSNAFPFNVNGGSSPPTLGSVTPPNGNAGASVNVTLAGTNFTTASVVNVSGGDVSMSNLNVVNNAQITCTLNINAGAPGGPRNVSVTTGAGTSGAQTFTVNGAVSGPTITTSSLPNGEVGASYNQSLAATGGTIPYDWSIISGALPGGLSLDHVTGTISGPASASGAFNFTVKVTDAQSQTATAALSITIAAAPSITTTSLPNGQVGIAYNSSVLMTGGTGPFTWSISLGALPANLGINPSTGAISGTPTTAGTANFTVTVTDSFGQSENKALSIVVNPAVSVTTTSLPGGQVSISYNSSVAATGGTLPYGWAITAGALPTNLGINGSTGAITGSPTAAGTFNFTVTVTDGVGQTANKALSIVINPAVSVTTTSLPGGQVGVSYNSSVAATGGTLPYGWSITAGALPTNLGINGSTGAITGSPTAAGTFNFTVTVTDGVGQTANKALSIVITSAPVPTLTSITPNQGGKGNVTPVTIAGNNFTAPVTVNSSAPADLSVSSVVLVDSHTITANLTASATATIGNRLISVTTPGGTSGTLAFKIVGLPSITSISPTSGARGTTVTITLQGSQFQGSSVAVDGTGITVAPNGQILNNGTTFVVNFTIAAGAPVGPRNVTVFNGAGSSNPVTFTVN